MEGCKWGIFKKRSKMMKKTWFLFSIFLLTGCSYSNLQGNSFADVWDEYAKEFRWGRQARFSQTEIQNHFLLWAEEFEKKRSQFVRLETEILEDGEEGDEKLQGNTVISGINVSKNIEQYKMALEKLQTLTEQQDELKILTRKVCEKQKSSVVCDSL